MQTSSFTTDQSRKPAKQGSMLSGSGDVPPPPLVVRPLKKNGFHFVFFLVTNWQLNGQTHMKKVTFIIKYQWSLLKKKICNILKFYVFPLYIERVRHNLSIKSLLNPKSRSNYNNPLQQSKELKHSKIIHNSKMLNEHI